MTTEESYSGLWFYVQNCFVNDSAFLPKDLEHEECLKVVVLMCIRITSHTNYKRGPTLEVPWNYSLVGLINLLLKPAYSDVGEPQFTLI